MLDQLLHHEKWTTRTAVSAIEGNRLGVVHKEKGNETALAKHTTRVLRSAENHPLKKY